MSSSDKVLGWAAATFLSYLLKYALSRGEKREERLEEPTEEQRTPSMLEDAHLYQFYLALSQLEEEAKKEVLKNIFTEKLMEYSALTTNLILRARGEVAYKILELERQGDNEKLELYKNTYNIIRDKELNSLFYIGLWKALELGAKTADEICYTILAVSISLYSDLLTYLYPKLLLTSLSDNIVDTSNINRIIRYHGLFSLKSIHKSLSELCPRLGARAKIFECIKKKCEDGRWPCRDPSYESPIDHIIDYLEIMGPGYPCYAPIELDAYFSMVWR